MQGARMPPPLADGCAAEGGGAAGGYRCGAAGGGGHRPCCVVEVVRAGGGVHGARIVGKVDTPNGSSLRAEDAFRTNRSELPEQNK